MVIANDADSKRAHMLVRPSVLALVLQPDDSPCAALAHRRVCTASARVSAVDLPGCVQPLNAVAASVRLFADLTCPAHVSLWSQVHQLKRLGSSCFVVTTHDGQFFPNVFNDLKFVSPFEKAESKFKVRRLRRPSSLFRTE